MFDTNIIINYLNGLLQAREVFTADNDKPISMMSWIEVMVGATRVTEPMIRSVLATCTVFPISSQIAERAAVLRRTTRLKLPDAIILATAEQEGRVLVTRNSRDFSAEDPQIQIPYTL